MKKLLLLATAATTLLSAGTYAADVTVDSNDLKMQLLGRFNFQSGYVKQSKNPGVDTYVSNNRKNFGFNTNAYVGAKITAEQDEMKYGAIFALSTSTRKTGSPTYDRSHIFVETKAGKLELGSNFSSSGAMSVDAFEIARATGGDGTDYAGTFDSGKATKGAMTISAAPMYPGLMLDSNNLDQTNSESSRKVTYYTPEFNGFQFGASYIPDSGNLGTLSIKDKSDAINSNPNVYTVTTGTTTTTYTEQKPVKDAYTLGLSFNHSISDFASVKFAAVGEYGKPVKNSGSSSAVTTLPAPAGGGAAPDPTTEVKNYKLAKLNTYQFGGVLTLGNYALSASYTNLGKSLTSAQVNGAKRNTTLYGFGGSYNQGPVGISLVYSKAKKFGNTMDSYTLGTDYKLAPGFLPYAEVVYFNGKASPLAVYKDNTKVKFKGMIFILGAKLAF